MKDLRTLLFEGLTALARRRGIELAEQPWVGLDAKAAFHAGVLEGVAMAIDLTVKELLDDSGLGRFVRDF